MSDDDLDYESLTDEEYEDIVADFLTPNKFELFTVFLFLSLMAIGVSGNLLVVYIVMRQKKLWTSMNFFLANLAVSDLLVLLICLPPTVVNDITKTFWFNSTVCKAIVFFQNTSVYVNILTLVCVSLERWHAIASPFKQKIWHTKRMITLIWITAAVLSIPEPLTVDTYPAVFNRPNFTTKWGTTCKESWSVETQRYYQLIQTIGLFFLPLLLITALCIHMAIVLSKNILSMGKRQVTSRYCPLLSLHFIENEVHYSFEFSYISFFERYDLNGIPASGTPLEKSEKERDYQT
uniref:G_PROTEIN_RECEP_F1_2 domain-containing protein n=1 Tax=Elaeophora elaphi TaxID=1147741 RepID=A0A0R3RIV5_9BILA